VSRGNFHYLPPVYTCLILATILFIQLFACDSNDTSHFSESAKSDLLPMDLDLAKLDVMQLVERASKLSDKGEFSSAAQLLKLAVQKDSQTVLLQHQLADAYLEGLESRQALETMEKAAISFPKSTETLLKLSEFQLILRRYDKALQTLQQVHDLHPSNAMAFFIKGMVRKELGDSTGAILEFQYATREDPSLIDAWINAGQLAQALGHDNALSFFQAGLRIDPDNLLLLSALASSHAGHGRSNEAIATYRRMISIDNDYSRAYFDLGLLYLDLDSLKKSHDHFNMAIETEPLFGRAYFYRGLTSELLNLPREALSDYKQALKLRPDDADVLEGLERLRNQQN